MISAGDFRNGVTFEEDGNVLQVVEFQHVKPGKGAAFVRTKTKNVITGAVIEKSYNPTAKFPTAFVERKDQYYVTGNFYPRPTVIYVEKSNNITFKDVTIVDAPFWTLHPAGCDDVLISHIRILNPLDVANSDGIDPDHCSNVRIIGCHVTCADDCICLKTSKGNAEYGPCENIIIANCTLISTSAAIKIGTEGVGDFRNVIVDNCIISRSNRGLSIQIRDGGNVENVTYSNCIIETRRFCPDWWGTAEPIVITTFNRDENTK